MMRAVSCIAFCLYGRWHWDVIAYFKGYYLFYYFCSIGSGGEPFSGACQERCDDYVCSINSRNGWLS
eukprot:3276776-Ditylum_brightwellii.AAC.1